MTIVIRHNASEHFPVRAEWQRGSVKQSDVYVSRDAAIDHLTGKFGKIRVLDRSEER